MLSTGRQRVRVKGVQGLATMLSICSKLPPGGQVKGRIEGYIREIVPSYGTFSYLGCSIPVRSNGEPCRRPVGPARRLRFDGSSGRTGLHEGSCNSRHDAVWYWKFYVGITDGGESILAEVWDAGSAILQKGDTPYAASEFGCLPIFERTNVMRDRMSQLQEVSCVLDMVGWHLEDPLSPMVWMVNGVNGSGGQMHAGYAHNIAGGTMRADIEVGSPEHHITYMAEPVYAKGTPSTLELGNIECIPCETPHVGIVSEDGDSNQSDMGQCISDSEDLCASSQVTSQAQSKFECGRQCVSSAIDVDDTDKKIRTMFLEHLLDTIAKVEVDIASKELDLQHSREYLEILKQEVISVDCM